MATLGRKTFTLLLALALACVVLAAQSKTKKELDEISRFLSEQSTSEDPKENLELMRANREKFSAKSLDSLLGLADGPACDSGSLMKKLARHFAKLDDEKLKGLLRLSVQLYFDRCKSQFEERMSRTSALLAKDARNTNLLSVDFYNKYHEMKVEHVDDIKQSEDFGPLFNASVPLLTDFVISKFGDKQFDPKKRSHAVKGATIVAENLATACPNHYNKLNSIIREIRDINSIVPLDDLAHLNGFSGDFKINAFRFRYCEEIIKARSYPKVTRRIREGLKKFKLTDIQFRPARFLGIGIGFGIFIIILVALCIVWGPRDS